MTPPKQSQKSPFKKTQSTTPPKNMAWLFLFLHQLVYMERAVLYPSECRRMPGKSDQQIRTKVNQDIAALCRAKFQKVVKLSGHKNYKVYLLF